MSRPEVSSLRLAELVASLSLGTDLGLGQPMEHILRSCLIGLRLGDRLDLNEGERASIYYVALLAWVGCHADSQEQAAWFGDDIALRAGTYNVDMVGLPAAAYLLRHIGAGRPAAERARLLAGLVTSGRREVGAFDMTHCRISGQLALRLGLGPEVDDALQQAFERWDGKGRPAGLAGEQVALPARIVHLAEIVEFFRRTGGIQAAIEVARRRRGTQFDPALVDLFCAEAPTLLAGLESATSWDEVIGVEPALRPVLSDEEIDSALESVADFGDLKCPYTAGHSREVANLAAEAARRSGIPEAEVGDLRRAGFLQDLGRMGISNAIWDKTGPLTEAEVERVRFHPFLTERMFSRTPRLANPAGLAGQHHERLDGSGYPRGLAAGALSPAARILAAADVYCAMLEPRPYRPARSPEQAATELGVEVRAGRLDGEAVNGVLGAAGHRVRRRREWPAGLTAREVEVLRLLARGRPNKEIAELLVISAKTVGNHVEHIYTKIDCSSRAEASLFAMQHGLLEVPAAER